MFHTPERRKLDQLIQPLNPIKSLTLSKTIKICCMDHRVRDCISGLDLTLIYPVNKCFINISSVKVNDSIKKTKTVFIEQNDTK